VVEDPEVHCSYLQHELGIRYDGAGVDALLEVGPHRSEFYELQTRLQFVSGTWIADIDAAFPKRRDRRQVAGCPRYDGRKIRKLVRTPAAAGVQDVLPGHGHHVRL